MRSDNVVRILVESPGQRDSKKRSPILGKLYYKMEGGKRLFDSEKGEDLENILNLFKDSKIPVLITLSCDKTKLTVRLPEIKTGYILDGRDVYKLGRLLQESGKNLLARHDLNKRVEALNNSK